MIKERKGDLLRSDAAIIAHQVNCLGIMGGRRSQADPASYFDSRTVSDIPADLQEE